MDPLSDVLSLLKLGKKYMFGGLDMGGQWSFEFPQTDGINCYAIVSGSCWLVIEGVPDPVRLVAGDCFLLPRGLCFRLASDPNLTPVSIYTLLSTPLKGSIRSYNGGGGALGIGGYFSLAGSHSNILLEMLPPVVHIQEKSDKATLRWLVERMMQELSDPQPGGFLVAHHLAHMMLVQALRLHMAGGLANGVGWLFALADPQIGQAIRAIHEDPARRWTVQELAELSCMSRSGFAVKFKATVGNSPMEYLTRWRMLLAGDRLTNSNDSISVIAQSQGYESESAFSTAFKRVMGCSPRQYGRS
jgi:AraC-like DNA-binding protein